MSQLLVTQRSPEGKIHDGKLAELETWLADKIRSEVVQALEVRLEALEALEIIICYCDLFVLFVHNVKSLCN